MENRLKLISVMTVTLVATLSSAFSNAESVSPQANDEELGMSQKLERVYDLYRRGNVVSLKQSEWQMGIGASYSTSNNISIDLMQSSRSIATQVFAGRGVGDGMEASVSMPYLVSKQYAETSSGTLFNETSSGYGDPTLRFVKMFPQKGVTAATVFAATLPVGSNKLSSKETHTSLGINLSKVLRPAFVSGGLTLERDWKSNVNGIGYSAGLGFFLNHALSVGGDIAGVAVLNPKPGMARDATTVGVKVAYQADPDVGIVVSASFGVGTNTPSATVGVSTYWRV